MKLPTLIAAIGLIGLLSSVSSADEAQQTFDSIYGTRVKQVQATRSGEDDAALAKQFIEAARGTNGAPELVVVLCKEAYDLARRHNLAVALDAMRLLAETSESERKAANEKIVKIWTILTRTGEPAARTAAVEELVRLYTKTGDTAFESNDLRAASVAYRQALLLATRHRQPSVDTLREKSKAVADRTSLMRQVEQLEETLLRDANDEAALTELAMIYLLDLPKPKEVGRLVPRMKEGKLKSQFQLAVQETSALNAPDSWKLGQWYIDLSKLSKGDRAAVARVKASVAIHRFLLLHRANDIDRTRATLMLNQLEIQMAKDAASGVGGRAANNPFKPSEGMKLGIHLSLGEVGTNAKFKCAVDPTRPWRVEGTRSVPGKVGGARYFDGLDDFIDLNIKRVPGFGRKRLTVAMWVKPEGADGAIFSVGGPLKGFAIYLSDGLLKFTARMGGKHYDAAMTQKISRRWFHVAGDVKANGEMTLFVDGKVVATGKCTHTPGMSGGQPLCLGSDTRNPVDPPGPGVANYKGKRFFKGAIDEFQMWVGK